jgi:hypothetical protein
MTPFRPFTNSPVAPSSCSMLLCQSSLPVQSTTCSEYAAIVLSKGVLRSMSRWGGVEAHSHVGAGHVAVVGIELWNLADEGEYVRRPVPHIRLVRKRERRANVHDMVLW